MNILYIHNDHVHDHGSYVRESKTLNSILCDKEKAK